MTDERIDVNINDLTLGDLEDVENVIGADGVKALMRGEVTAKAMIALTWVVKRVEIPGFSMDDARKMPLSIFSVDGSGLDPTDGTGSEISPGSVSTLE